MKMTFNLNKFWYGVREYKGRFAKKSWQYNKRQRHSDEKMRILKILKNNLLCQICAWSSNYFENNFCFFNAENEMTHRKQKVAMAASD